MAQGAAALTIDLLKQRIANGQRPQVEDEFLRLQSSLNIKSTQTQDLKVEQNPDEIYALVTMYAIALGYSAPSIFIKG